jgi:16S rRNA (adenine1518-N6/adenine1519-N6)-dimethyltransferase
MKDYIDIIKQYKIEQDLNDLNQLFLIDENIINDLVNSADIKKDDIILEIGPGMGFITEKLADKADKVIAVELDKQFKDVLTNLPKNVRVIFGDAKKYLIKERDGVNKIVSSPPYNICEPLMHILTRKASIHKTVLITPIGFFDKMKENPVFSSFFRFKLIRKIPKIAFYPVPRVDSEIISIERRDDYEKDQDKKAFIIRSLYIQKDKKIKNALRSTLINIYNLDDKSLTKKETKNMIDSLKIENDILNKKMQNYNYAFYERLSNLILDIIS